MIARKILIVLVLALAALPAAAQDDMAAAAQEAWLKAATPGPVHAFLAEKTGDWNVKAVMWMAPGAEPVVSHSTSHAEMMLGGRFLMEHVQGENMGMPFEGMGSTGYDNATGVVTAVWMDSFGTVTVVMTGKYAEPGDPLEVTGRMFDPSIGAEITMRSVTTFTSRDAHHVDYYMTMAGMPETRMMEMDYTRQ